MYIGVPGGYKVEIIYLVESCRGYNIVSCNSNYFR